MSYTRSRDMIKYSVHMSYTRSRDIPFVQVNNTARRYITSVDAELVHNNLFIRSSYFFRSFVCLRVHSFICILYNRSFVHLFVSSFTNYFFILFVARRIESTDESRTS